MLSTECESRKDVGHLLGLYTSLCFQWPLEKGRLDNAQDLYASFISMLALIFLSQL